MAEERKRKRVAHIGNMGNVQGTSKAHSDNGMAQADCNLVYDIMQSMNKSQIMSYQELQEFRSKENCISRTNSEQNSSKQNAQKQVPKQIKKFVPEKTFPLMAKCQKSMKYLKKNRCIPKPRAHVGFIPRPPPKPISNLKLNDMCSNKSVSNNTKRHESSIKIKHNSKRSRCFPELNKFKIPKISQSLNNSGDKSTFQTESSHKPPQLISNAETDSDNEFEQFIQKHHPAKCTASSNDSSSDSSIIPRKIRKSNKIKKKKRKKIACLAKVSKDKMTRKTLTESEESAESQVECEENNCNSIIGKDSCEQQFPIKRFQRIFEYENSDSASDTYVNDSGTLNYDSLNSSDDENIVETKSSNNENANHVLDLEDSERLDILPAEPSSVASSSTSLSELTDTLHLEILKSKCKIPCSVVIERDPLLDQKVASLCTNNSSVNNMVPVSNLCDDDDDCIIISETSTNLMNDNSKNIRQPTENRNSLQVESTGVSKSSCISEVLNDMQNKHMHNEKLIFNLDGLGQQTETNLLLSNVKSSEIVCCDKDRSLEVQKDDVEEIRSDTASSTFLSDTGNSGEKEECFNVSKITRHSPKNVNSVESEPKTLNCEKLTSDTENGTFNVQILSVKSLNESDVIVLSDDDEEKDMETVPIVNETNKSVPVVNELSKIAPIARETSKIAPIARETSKIAPISKETIKIAPIAKETIKIAPIPKETTKIAPIAKETSKIAPIVKEKDGTATDDSDVEIICLDLSVVNKEKSVNENIRNVSKSGTNKKVTSGEKENSSSSLVQPIVLNEEDCIILDVDIPSKNSCTAKFVGKVQQNSQVNVKAVDIVNNERENSSISEETMTISDNLPELDKNSILKILDTIDINCIRKVLNETTNTDTRIDKNSDSVSAENSFCENVQTSNRTADLIPEKLKQSQNDASASQLQASIDAGIDPSEINKISSLKTSPVETCEENIKLVKNSNVLHNIIKDVSEDVPSPVKSDSVLSSSNSDKNLTFCNSSTNLPARKLSVSEKKIIASSYKSELNTLHHSQKNQLLPRYTKMENSESGSDVMDILVAKSIHNLEEKEKETIVPLVELYQAEYIKYMEIKSTEKNVTAGLKLLEESQARKLLHISSSIKQMAKNDLCFHKVKNELVSNKNEDDSFIKNCSGKTEESLDQIKKDDNVRIFNPSVVEGASEILRSQSVGPSSTQEVYNFLINGVCAECGKNAMAACSGCAKVYYCSEKCGMSYWNKGHCDNCIK